MKATRPTSQKRCGGARPLMRVRRTAGSLRLHAHRVAGRHRHHRHSGGAALAGLARAKEKAWTIGCLSNLKQLETCWHLYAVDNQDVLPPNDSVMYIGGGIAVFQHFLVSGPCPH